MSRPSFPWVACLFAAAPLFLGCGPGQPDQEPGRARQAVINGDPSGPEDDAVVEVAIFGGRGYEFGGCTGTLIAPKLLLTARHCVARTEQGGIACDSTGAPLAGGGVVSNRSPEQIGVRVGSVLSSRIDAVGTQIFHSGATNLCNNDIALVVLDKALSAPIAPLRLQAPPVEGELLTAVGWGVSNNSAGERRRRTDIPIKYVGPAGFFGSGIGPNEFAVGEAICQGDSGGPAFAASGAVVGVVSRGGNGSTATFPPWAGCIDQGGLVTENLYTRVDGFRDLIETAFAAADATPWLEGEPDPRKATFGETCEGGDACQSELCVAVGETSFCTQTCDPVEDPCPEGFTCQTSADNGSLCLAPSEGGCAVGAPAGRGATPWTLFLIGALGFGGALLRRRRLRCRG